MIVPTLVALMMLTPVPDYHKRQYEPHQFTVCEYYVDKKTNCQDVWCPGNKRCDEIEWTEGYDDD